MDAFLTRKRLRTNHSPPPQAKRIHSTDHEDEEESTDVKLAILSSLHPEKAQVDLLELLLDCDGSVENVITVLSVAGSVHHLVQGDGRPFLIFKAPSPLHRETRAHQKRMRNH